MLQITSLFIISFFCQPYVGIIEKKENSLMVNINIKSQECGYIEITGGQIKYYMSCGYKSISKGIMLIENSILKHDNNILIISSKDSLKKIKLKCSNEKSKEIISFWNDAKNGKIEDISKKNKRLFFDE